MLTIVGEKATTTKEVVRAKDDHEKMKTELKLRKQAHKEEVHDDRIMMMDTSMMSLVNIAYHEERKTTIRLKRIEHSSSTESWVSPPPY